MDLHLRNHRVVHHFCDIWHLKYDGTRWFSVVMKANKNSDIRHHLRHPFLRMDCRLPSCPSERCRLSRHLRHRYRLIPAL